MSWGIISVNITQPKRYMQPATQINNASHPRSTLMLKSQRKQVRWLRNDRHRQVSQEHEGESLKCMRQENQKISEGESQTEGKINLPSRFRLLEVFPLLLQIGPWPLQWPYHRTCRRNATNPCPLSASLGRLPAVPKVSGQECWRFGVRH